jgi:hypothetical protein
MPALQSRTAEQSVSMHDMLDVMSDERFKTRLGEIAKWRADVAAMVATFSRREKELAQRHDSAELREIAVAKAEKELAARQSEHATVVSVHEKSAAGRVLRLSIHAKDLSHRELLLAEEKGVIEARTRNLDEARRSLLGEAG